MKIIGVEHKVKETNVPEEYLEKIAGALEYKPDIVVGPDYGLSYLGKNGKIRFDLREKAIKDLENLSKNCPNTVIIPGTGPFVLEEGIMGHSAPLIKKGKNLLEFRKETDVENSSVAKENGLTYGRGNSDRNKFYHNGEKIAVEICSDHGKQKIDRDTFLELILAYDDRAGFWIRANNNDFSRYAIVNDGRKPFVAGYEFNLNTREKLSILGHKKLNSSLFLFNLNDDNSQGA